MTLLELTVVILVLLSLISILFVGARAWKKGSDRAANILNIRNVQQAVRGHENMHGLAPGNALLPEIIFSQNATGAEGETPATPASQGYLKEPKPPTASGATAYTYLNVVPEIGVLYISNVTAIGADYAPDAGSYADW